MNLFHAFILGIVEGVTEFLPISSTGHLILAGKLLGLPETEFLKTFDIVIQLGAILAVVFLYARSFLVNIEILKRVLVAFIPTAVLGAVFYKVIKHFFMGSSDVVIGMLFFGGIFLVLFEKVHQEGGKEDLAELSYKDVVWIGLFQSIAMLPGVSRAAATIIGGLILGMKRKAAVEFSFLLAVPTMMAACGLDIIKSRHEIAAATDAIPFLAVGFITSFFVALVTIKFLLRFIQRNNFIAFGVYRILAAILFWIIIK